METTIFLAQIWGPVMLALGLGMLISRDRYLRMYRELGHKDFSILVFAMAAIAAGVVQIGAHNVWGSLPEVLISLFGWLLLVKGAALAIFPKLVGKVARCYTKNSAFVITGGVILLVIGAYLSYLGFLM